MRRIARGLLLLFVFAIPWEYSLDLGPPWGNVARILGLLLVLIALPTVLLAGRIRKPSALQWLTLALYLWFSCTCFWTIEPRLTLEKMRGYFQEMMIVWLVWEFAETAEDLRAILRAWLAGSCVLALLTVADFTLADLGTSDQFRFVAVGQDPNDVARFLVFGFPIAALLFEGNGNRLGRALALSYLPLGLAGVLLTASRSGFVGAGVALVGCALLLLRDHARGVLAGILALPLMGIASWFALPYESIRRLGTIAEQLQGGDLNQRLNIWTAGWNAFVQRPILGHGAGVFVIAAGLAPIDTAHNTPLAILVEGGLCGLLLASAIVAVSVRSIHRTQGPLCVALTTLLATWCLLSFVGTVGENRTTWLLLAVIGVASRLLAEESEIVGSLCYAHESPIEACSIGSRE
jgi:O-antigen ligase